MSRWASIPSMVFIPLILFWVMGYIKVSAWQQQQQQQQQSNDHNCSTDKLK